MRCVHKPEMGLQPSAKALPDRPALSKWPLFGTCLTLIKLKRQVQMRTCIFIAITNLSIAVCRTAVTTGRLNDTFVGRRHSDTEIARRVPTNDALFTAIGKREYGQRARVQSAPIVSQPELSRCSLDREVVQLGIWNTNLFSESPRQYEDGADITAMTSFSLSFPHGENENYLCRFKSILVLKDKLKLSVDAIL
ncbi:hypothetical protein EVAR_8998_1 [Eumeta japonica]|uniref:Uncharacterized protein n=1 Tax=Eumeta variegata TaxID=151549 RepID=A0A4C1WPK9_EUMVA|nr:hypothetical protein EVAR_8998_1 [Eumeta japonica]